MVFWGGYLGRDKGHRRLATQRANLKLGSKAGERTWRTKATCLGRYFVIQKGTTRQWRRTLVFFHPCTMSKSVPSPCCSVWQAGSLKFAMCWKSRVPDLLVNGVNNFRGQWAEEISSPDSITVGGGLSNDCRQRLPHRCTGASAALEVS